MVLCGRKIRCPAEVTTYLATVHTMTTTISSCNHDTDSDSGKALSYQLNKEEKIYKLNLPGNRNPYILLNLFFQDSTYALSCKIQEHNYGQLILFPIKTQSY